VSPLGRSALRRMACDLPLALLLPVLVVFLLDARRVPFWQVCLFYALFWLAVSVRDLARDHFVREGA
jgi:hypothetical protein